MSTRLIPEALARDLTETLARLKQARMVHPNHREPRGQQKPHAACEICVTQTRLDWLIDHRLPKPQETL